MRLIDADDAIYRIRATISINTSVSAERNTLKDGLMLCEKLIERKCPTIEAVSVVRCKDCKYWQESQYYPQVMACTYVIGATFTRQHDDYCSRGERKDDE